MAKRKGKIRQQNAPKRESRKFLIIAAIAAVVILVIAGNLLLYQKEQVPAGQEVSRAGAAEAGSPADHFQKLLGRWRRPDGGYIIDIRSVDPDGNMAAGYFNPSSINVSQARAQQRDGKIQVFIELRDRGYPGATYSLTLGPKGAVLAGSYFQPAAGQSFGVVFSRLPSP
jgi:hypothetical protein